MLQKCRLLFKQKCLYWYYAEKKIICTYQRRTDCPAFTWGNIGCAVCFVQLVSMNSLVLHLPEGLATIKKGR